MAVNIFYFHPSHRHVLGAFDFSDIKSFSHTIDDCRRQYRMATICHPHQHNSEFNKITEGVIIGVDLTQTTSASYRFISLHCRRRSYTLYAAPCMASTWRSQLGKCFIQNERCVTLFWLLTVSMKRIIGDESRRVRCMVDIVIANILISYCQMISKLTIEILKHSTHSWVNAELTAEDVPFCGFVACVFTQEISPELQMNQPVRQFILTFMVIYINLNIDTAVDAYYTNRM